MHPLAYVAATALISSEAALKRFTGLLASPRNLTGLAALAVLLVITILPFWRERLGLRYEYWRTSHALLAIVAAILLLHHAFAVGSYSAEAQVMLSWAFLAGLSLVATFLLYALRPWRMWREPWHLESISKDGDATWRLNLIGPEATRFRFAPGQFIWITLAPHRPPFHDHPFSIASAQADLPRMRLIIRASGDYTGKLDQLVPGARVAIDGPHGSFVLTPAADNVLMIAGGVGIAPLLSMLEHAAATGDRRHFCLLYADRNEDAFAGLDRIRVLERQIDLDVRLLTDKPAPEDGRARAGRLSAHIDEVVPSLGRAEAYVCGPPAMMAMATDKLLDLGMPAGAIHYERFDYLAAGGRLDRQRFIKSIAVVLALLALVTAFAFRGLAIRP